MKKKSLITMVASLSLVAAVGVGSTLAYLSSTSGPLVNTFTASNGYTGNAAVKVQETKLTSNNDSETTFKDGVTYSGTYGAKTDYSAGVFTGNSYVNLLPGDTLIKDPSVTLGANSINSYIIIKVTGVDALDAYSIGTPAVDAYSITGWDNAKWEKIANADKTTTGLTSSKDGYYVYHEGTKYIFAAGKTTSNLFTTVTYNSAVNAVPTTTAPSISVSAAAVQGDNVIDKNVAFAALPATF